MEITHYINALDSEGQLLASTVERAGTGATVSTCPDWQVRDLLRHTGMVHRWATSFVTEGHRTYQPDGGEPDLDGEKLLDWFREGHGLLVAALSDADPGLECWTFMPAPSPLAFWARRQAHETAVHRVDAESVSDGTRQTIRAEFAVDGIDELLRSFHARPKSRVRTAEPRVLRIRTTDPGAETAWTVRLSQEPAVTVLGDDATPADCEISGPAARVYLALWNRLPLPRVTGDPALARLWREKSAITWG